MEIKTVSIIGLGALGILFGNHLSKRMPKENLRIIADHDRIKRYQHDGVYCNGKPCNFNYIEPDTKCKPADLLIFTVKFNGLNEAIKAVKNHVGDNTVILSFLNGITSEGIIAKTYGMEKVLDCVAQGMDAVKIGNKLTYDHMGTINFGDRQPGEMSVKTRSVDEFFEKMEIPHEIDMNMKKRLWGKFMLNVGVNQTVAVYGTGYGDVQIEGKAREIMISAMREVIALSEKEGVNLTEDDLRYWLDLLAPLNPDGKPSMRQDIEAKRYSEVDLFSGAVIELGQKHNIATPTNEDLYSKIKSIESKY